MFAWLCFFWYESMTTDRALLCKMLGFFIIVFHPFVTEVCFWLLMEYCTASGCIKIIVNKNFEVLPKFFKPFEYQVYEFIDGIIACYDCFFLHAGIIVYCNCIGKAVIDWKMVSFLPWRVHSFFVFSFYELDYVIISFIAMR